MKAAARSSLCCVILVAALACCVKSFVVRPPLRLKSRTVPAVAAQAIRGGGHQGKQDPEVSVFDAGETAVSWEDYKKEKPDEFKLTPEDEMQCWNTDDCPVEDPKKFTKAWELRSAERNPSTETHFDSEGEWEEETKGAWAKKWYEDVGEDDLHQENVSPTSKNGFGI